MIPSDFSDETSENSFHAADEKNFIRKRKTDKKNKKKTPSPYQKNNKKDNTGSQTSQNSKEKDKSEKIVRRIPITRAESSSVINPLNTLLGVKDFSTAAAAATIQKQPSLQAQSSLSEKINFLTGNLRYFFYF